VVDSLISPDVVICVLNLRAFAHACADGGVAIRIHALLYPRSRLCLPLTRGSTSLRDRRCHVLVVTMAIVMVGLHRSI
jgi:hypothetical protein